MDSTNQLRVMAALVTSIALAGSAWGADYVHRKSDGKPLAGEIESVTRDQVVIKPKIGEAITVPTSDIAYIRWDGEPRELITARASEQQGRLDRALESYKDIATSTSISAKSKSDVLYFISRVNARQALADPAKLGDAISTMENYRKNNPTSYHFYEATSLLGQMYMAKKDWDNAARVFQDLQAAGSDELKALGRTAQAKLLVEKGDLPGAIKAYDAILATNPDGSARYDAMLGKANCLRLQKQYQPAIQILNNVIDGVSPDDTSIQAEAYVRQGNCFQGLGKKKEALLAYLHVDVLYSKETALHAEALHHLAGLWPVIGKADRASDARRRLKELYPNSDWASKAP